MASYTMQLREYIEQTTQYDSTLSMRQKIEEGRKKLFDFEYPIFDESYRKVFETHFIRKFYMREIGFETEGLFKFNLETWLIINMPYFNKMFESELIDYDPLINSKVDVTHDKTNDKSQNDTRDIVNDSTSNGASNTTTSNTTATDTTKTQNSDGTVTDDNFDRQLESNNPDSRLAITTNDGQGVIEYASNIKENNENNKKTTSDNTTVTGSSDTTDTGKNDNISSLTGNVTQNDKLISTINDVETFVQSRVGKIGVQSYSKMIQEYREALLRVENTIFDEMQQLFMLVY